MLLEAYCDSDFLLTTLISKSAMQQSEHRIILLNGCCDADERESLFLNSRAAGFGQRQAALGLLPRGVKIDKIDALALAGSLAEASGR